ncbi:Transcriptional regulator, AbiEi antitoxin, Type IV TA system [Candidatus Electrothrix aarhusensis]|jgi:predicted transcriptional regulator of viral defense system|uniref:Transcriptional regulator, AbiEi antitoxin, Type IV TA system n=1 Tax=Candidatus Electrothrix aarhusensis TaxID=1859131 RepID=A0A3S3SNB7_9BACT|nr:Transcriptional regulator, AbiEi antitoxin, Type IV TA system [Candidatus Electrothrix aarhusensis]
MNKVTEMLIQQGYADRFVRATQLDRLITGSPARRYSLVHRAMKSGELVQLQRGLYILADRFRSTPCHPFAAAQALAPTSYISFETALAYHGWIPEQVFTVSSAVPGRKSRKYQHDQLGAYSFHPLAVQPGCFLELVDRVRVSGQTVLIARPCRALMDLVCLRKVPWNGLDWLSEGLRIELDFLSDMSREDIHTLSRVYKHKRVRAFLAALRSELHLD